MIKNRKAMIVIVVAALSITAASFLILKKIPQKITEQGKLNKAELLYERASSALKSNEEDKAITAFSYIVDNYPVSEYGRESLRDLGKIFEAKNDYQKAKYYYTRLLNDFPSAEDISDIKASRGNVNMREMMSPVITDDSIEYEVQSGDSLFAIARRFNTTIELIKKVNNLRNDIIKTGQKLKIIAAKFSISVDKSRNELVLEKNGEEFKVYSVSTGKDNSTPVGNFIIEEKMVKPVWYKVGAVVLPDSEEYELGARWMGLSADGYGIHGTSDESTIGSQITQGCVRMRNDDVIELFDIVPSGTEVRIT